MQKKLNIGLILGAIVLPGLVLLEDSPVQAQRRSSYSRYCHHLASDYADRNSSVRGAAEGAAEGAIVGGIIGGIVGDDVLGGAAVGAGLGAIDGSYRRRGSWDRAYRYRYNRCMRDSRYRY